MPIDKNDYHPKWTLIVRLIRLRVIKRFGVDCCEGSIKFPDCHAINYDAHPITGARVVLTTAHLDGDRSNNNFNNLARLCQRCHLAHDLGHHVMNRRYGRHHSRPPQLTLFNLKPFIKFMKSLISTFLILMAWSTTFAQQIPKETIVVFKDSVRLRQYTSKTSFVTSNEKLILLEVDPNAEYKITKTVYDTVYKIIETVEPTIARVSHVNMTTYANSLKPGVSDKSFSAVTDLAKVSSSTLSFSGSLVEFWGERFAGHGTVSIFIDNNLAATFNQGIAPFTTDLQRGSPTFRKKIPKGQHTISVRAAINQQHIVDFFTVYDYSLIPRVPQ